MHELSVAQNIAEIVESEAKNRQASCVTGVLLEIGELAGIELEALEFAWSAVIENTLLNKAKLQIDGVRGKAKCISCGKEFDIHELFDLCPDCKSFGNEILQGKELRIKSIDIEY